MKQIVFLTAVLLLCCSCSKTELEKNECVSIVDCYVNDLGYKNFVLSNKETVEVRIDKNCIKMYDSSFDETCSDYSNATLQSWQIAEVGMAVAKYDVYDVDPIFGRNSRPRCYTYRPLIQQDASIKHVVTRITKYDGELNKLEGKIELRSALLHGTSGDGYMKGEGMQCPNFFINVYFDDHDPLTVNAAENQLWLDVEVGDTVIEQRIKGRTSFIPVPEP